MRLPNNLTWMVKWVSSYVFRASEKQRALAFREKRFEDFFPVDEASSEPDYWRLRYDGLNSCDIGVNPLGTDATKLAGLYVDRPCRDLRLWDVLFAILNMGGVVLFFPGGR